MPFTYSKSNQIPFFKYIFILLFISRPERKLNNKHIKNNPKKDFSKRKKWPCSDRKRVTLDHDYQKPSLSGKNRRGVHPDLVENSLYKSRQSPSTFHSALKTWFTIFFFFFKEKTLVVPRFLFFYIPKHTNLLGDNRSLCLNEGALLLFIWIDLDW